MDEILITGAREVPPLELEPAVDTSEGCLQLVGLSRSNLDAAASGTPAVARGGNARDTALE
jgi:hypothetical protein